MGKALSEATESPRPEPHRIACVKWQAVEVGDCLPRTGCTEKFACLGVESDCQDLLTHMTVIPRWSFTWAIVVPRVNW